MGPAMVAEILIATAVDRAVALLLARVLEFLACVAGRAAARGQLVLELLDTRVLVRRADFSYAERVSAVDARVAFQG